MYPSLAWLGDSAACNPKPKFNNESGPLDLIAFDDDGASCVGSVDSTLELLGVFNCGLSAGGKLTFKDVLVAVELSFKLKTPIEVFNDASRFSTVASSSCVAITVVFLSVLLSGELGKLGSALSQVLVLELVFGVVVELTPTDGVFILELESELILLNVATGKCSARTF